LEVLFRRRLVQIGSDIYFAADDGDRAVQSTAASLKYLYQDRE